MSKKLCPSVVEFKGTDAEQVLIGSLLGDGCLKRNYLCKTLRLRYSESHSLAQQKYLLWKKSVLIDYFNIRDFTYQRGKYSGINIYSNSSLLLNYYYPLFYKEKKKIISEKIFENLRLLGLAVWYMDDGYFVKKSYNFKITMAKINSELAKKYFKSSFGLKCSIEQKCNSKTTVDLLFNKKSTRIFLKLIKPYITEDLFYKVNISQEDFAKIKEKRKKQREYRKIYLLNPEVKERYKKHYKEYAKRPSVQKKWKERNKSKEFIEYQKGYYKKNKKRISLRNKNYREKNRHIIRKRGRELYHRNKERIKEYNKKPEIKERMKNYHKEYYQRPEVKKMMEEYRINYYSKNKEKINLKNRLYHRKNRARRTEYERLWRKNNPDKVKEYARKTYEKRRMNNGKMC